MSTTRKVAKATNAQLSGLLPDPIAKRKSAVSRSKAICTYTTANSKMRRKLREDNFDKRRKACEKKKGDIYICGYNRKGKTVKSHCRKLPRP